MDARYSTTSKACSKCKEIKLFSDFRKATYEKSGLRSSCKTCAAKDEAAWRAANPEKARAKVTAWAAKNPEKKRAASNAWKAANLERARALSSSWAAKNPEKMRAKAAVWASKNPEARRIQKQNYRAMLKNATGKLSKNIKESLHKLQKGMCPCCKQPLGDDYHLDHIQPLALGGPNTDDNMQLLRAICNMQKHAKHPVDFMQSRGFLL